MALGTNHECPIVAECPKVQNVVTLLRQFVVMRDKNDIATISCPL